MRYSRRSPENEPHFHFRSALGWPLTYQTDTVYVRMGTSIETAAMTAERWRTRGWTTIVLESNDSGDWRATQHGVDVEGRGETAALAAANYCRQLERTDE